MFTEDVTELDNFADLNDPEVSAEGTFVPVTWHGKQYGRGRFVNGFIDKPASAFEDRVINMKLLSPGEEDQFESHRILSSDTAAEINDKYSLTDFEYDHSFVLNVAGRQYNIKHLLLPNSVDELKGRLGNPVNRTRGIGYSSTVAIALLASLSLYVYQQNRNRLLQEARNHASEIAAATKAHERTINFAQHELRYV